MLKSYFFIQLIALLGWYLAGGVSYSEGNLAFFVIMSVLNSLLFFNRIKACINTSFCMFVFCVGYLIVFFQNYLEVLLGSYSLHDMPYTIAGADEIIRCAAMSSMGMICFFLGVLSIPCPREPVLSGISSEKIAAPNMKLPGKDVLLWGALGGFLLGNYKFLFNVTYSQELLESRSFLSNMTFIFFQVVFFIFLAYTCHSFIQLNRKVSLKEFCIKAGWSLNLTALIFILVLVQLGDRGEALTIVLAYYSAFLVVSRRKCQLKYLLIYILAGGLFCAFLAQFRTFSKDIPLGERIIESANIFSEKNEHLFFVTEELARSVATFHNAVATVPDFNPYLYGIFHIADVVNIIPGAAAVFRNLLGLDHFRYWNSAYFCTWIYWGDEYLWGTGSSWNADLYLNYGLWGILLGMFIWGYILACLRKKIQIQTPSFYILLAYLILAGYSLYLNRSNNFYCIRTLVYATVFFFCYQKFVNFYQAKRNKKKNYL